MAPRSPGYTPLRPDGEGPPSGLGFAASPQATASLWSRIMFSWLNPLLKAGWKKRKLTMEDVYPLPPDFSSERVRNEFDRRWRERTTQGASAKRRPVWQLIGTMWDMWASIYIGAMALKFASDMFKFVGPLSLQALLRWLADPDVAPPFWAAWCPAEFRGYFYVILMSFTSFLDYLCLAHTYNVGWGLGIRLRSTVIVAVRPSASRTHIPGPDAAPSSSRP